MSTIEGKIITSRTEGERAYWLAIFKSEPRGLPVYLPATAHREGWFIPGETPSETIPVTHLFANQQTYNQPQFRTICNRTLPESQILFTNPDTSLMCEECVTIENIWAANA